MTALPPFASRDRAIGAALVIGCGIVQVVALAMAAFATRDAFAALHNDAALAPRTVSELAIAGIIAALCLHVSRRQAEGLGQGYAIALRRALYGQIAQLPKSRHELRRTGALSLRFVGDLSAARLWFGRGLPDVLTALVILPGVVAILVSLDPSLALAGLVPLGLALVLMVGVAWNLERRHKRLRSRRANIAIAMIERIAIAPDLDLLGRTDKELRALDEQGAMLRSDAVARRGRTSAVQAILQAGVAISGLSILWFASQGVATPAIVAASLAVIALVAMPLQDLGSAWDQYCAWSVARDKARRLLSEPGLSRKPVSSHGPVSVELQGNSFHFAVEAGAVARLDRPDAVALARIIGGLDQDPDVTVTFGGRDAKPHVVFIGDTHIGLQGSLRRSATLGARKRPSDQRIDEVLRAFGLGGILAHSLGLDQRIAENGKGWTGTETLRLDLARAVLASAEVIVIASLRWDAEQDREALMTELHRLSPATKILAAVTSRSMLTAISKGT